MQTTLMVSMKIWDTPFHAVAMIIDNLITVNILAKMYQYDKVL